MVLVNIDDIAVVRVGIYFSSVDRMTVRIRDAVCFEIIDGYEVIAYIGKSTEQVTAFGELAYARAHIKV